MCTIAHMDEKKELRFKIKTTLHNKLKRLAAKNRRRMQAEVELALEKHIKN